MAVSSKTKRIPAVHLLEGTLVYPPGLVDFHCVHCVRDLCVHCVRASDATHLADSMTDSPISQPTTRTRSSTLQDRLGAHQNGSTDVRSDGQLTADLHLVPRESEDLMKFKRPTTSTRWTARTSSRLRKLKSRTTTPTTPTRLRHHQDPIHQLSAFSESWTTILP